MIEAMWLLVIGAILLFLGWSKKAGGYNKPAMWIGALMLIVGAFWPGYGLYTDTFTIGDFTGTTAYDADVTVANGTHIAGPMIPGTAASNNEDITYTFTETAKGNTFVQNYSCANYTVSLTVPSGSSNDQLYKVTYSINVDQEHEGVDCFYSSGDIYDVYWYAYKNADAAVKSQEGGSGSINVLATDSLKLELRIRWNNAATDPLGDQFATTGETLTVPVTINGQTYDIVAINIA